MGSTGTTTSSESGRYAIEVTADGRHAVFIEDYSSPIWVTEPIPSNAITVGKAKLNKKKGTAKLQVKVPGAGIAEARGQVTRQEQGHARRRRPR